MAYASEIRDAVLQYAIQGRLTEQLDSDSSTDTLADIIAIDKQALIKHKSARNRGSVVSDRWAEVLCEKLR